MGAAQHDGLTFMGARAMDKCQLYSATRAQVPLDRRADKVESVPLVQNRWSLLKFDLGPKLLSCNE